MALNLPRSVTHGSLPCIALFASLLFASPAHAQDALTDSDGAAGQPPHISVQLGYDLAGGATRENIAPGASWHGQSTLWSDVPGTHRILLLYGAGLGLFGALDSRADYARSLLLPGNASLQWGAGYAQDSGHGLRFLWPEVGIEAKAIAWGGETVARQVALHGGAGMSVGRSLDVSVQVGRAMNGVGAGDRRRVLAALGGPGSWATFESTTAEVRMGPGELRCFGSFGAYLADSKYSVVPKGRRILSLGIEKGF